MEDFKFKKKFGQNFISDTNLINSIVEKTNILTNSLVIEIGPGSGNLTNSTVKKAKNVLAYEIDLDLKPILEEKFKDTNNIDFIFDDFLNRNIEEDIKKYEYEQIYVVANLPYYITTPIIMKLIESKLKFKKIVIMVQKEVGDRFSSPPKSRDYGSLTVFLNYHFDIKKIINVSRNLFFPKPNVDSVIIEFSEKENRILVKDEKLFYKLVKDSFQHKRKTIKNNLNNYDLEKIEEILRNHNLDLSVRAEAIKLEIFIEIANNLV